MLYSGYSTIDILALNPVADPQAPPPHRTMGPVGGEPISIKNESEITETVVSVYQEFSIQHKVSNRSELYAPALYSTTGAHALMIGDGPVKPARDIGGPIKGVGILEKIVLVPSDRHPDWTISCLRRHMKKICMCCAVPL
ncbi:Uncharacterized protein FWK35_00007864 [Aphis craccivora]|uniref:Uncharacterized protein n=1 Tax=Aphis craccivora TaxID=307492 RepID=A0A6G0Z6C7_APHCR|nr:Uncharacterized protein FWK35_00007864 [Aphis craccivora]